MKLLCEKCAKERELIYKDSIGGTFLEEPCQDCGQERLLREYDEHDTENSL